MRAGVRTQTVAVGILADRLEDLAHRALDPRLVDGRRPTSGTACSGFGSVTA